MPPRAPDPDAPDVPRHKSGHVNVGKFLAMKARPKWMEESRRVRDDLHKNKAEFPKKVLAAMPTPGIPPAPVDAYGRHESVAQHLYQWDPSTTQALHFQPEKHTMMINGRPMQASSLLS